MRYHQSTSINATKCHLEGTSSSSISIKSIDLWYTISFHEIKLLLYKCRTRTICTHYFHNHL